MAIALLWVVFATPTSGRSAVPRDGSNRSTGCYVVIGGIAAVLHGVPRATFDLDLLIDATTSNAQRLLSALAEAGFVTAELTTPASILEHVITVFKDRVRIDVQTSTPGLIFEQAWARRVTMFYQGQGLFVVTRDDLIASKRAAGRAVDLEDVRLLEVANGDAP